MPRKKKDLDKKASPKGATNTKMTDRIDFIYCSATAGHSDLLGHCHWANIINFPIFAGHCSHTKPKLLSTNKLVIPASLQYLYISLALPRVLLAWEFQQWQISNIIISKKTERKGRNWPMSLDNRKENGRRLFRKIEPYHHHFRE